MNELEDPAYLAPGAVALVGAGPGDPDLLTLGAVKALRAADAVVYDALVSPEILAFIPPGRELIAAGKRGGRPSASQSDICDTLVELAREGKRVVRLKGGDPFVFGRGGEEALRLAQEGIPFRVIPGLTSGIAGPAYAGIPVTHREVNANVALITGQERAEDPEGEHLPHITRVDWEELGRIFPVLVLYMAMRNLHLVASRLLSGGRSPETPVAVIRWATTPRQETMVSTLGRVVEDSAACKMDPPAIVVIGEVVNLRKKIKWFNDREIIPPRPGE
ncbi:MAG: uroporphyrinogen-III C-methyltransferase [Magnetococcales bacterium]|nr:uroporphyrinogen-III C-methyltransferase [Magnetococcales bacterium]